MAVKKASCEGSIRPERRVAILTGVQVIRALLEIWGYFDSEWPTSIQPLVMPTVYVSLVLGGLLSCISVCATWSAYKIHLKSLNITWWIHYVLTVLSFFNSCTHLSILCIGKGAIISGCVSSKTAEACLECQVVPECVTAWEEQVIWTAIVTMLTLAINVGLAYTLYRIKSKQNFIFPSQRRTSGRGPPPPYQSPGPEFDSDGFQVIELK